MKDEKVPEIYDENGKLKDGYIWADEVNDFWFKRCNKLLWQWYIIANIGFVCGIIGGGIIGHFL